MKRKFWMVLGNGMPVQRHYIEQVAKSEAERLARTNRGQEFVVLEAIRVCKATDVVWDEYEVGDELPF
jgi:hypothetical protein